MAMEASNLFRVDGMIAVITGGGSGIGLVMARALATNGASRVYILGRRLEVLESAARSHPGILVPVQCDVTSKSSLQSVVDGITTQSGHVNLLIANSGVAGPSNKWDPTLSVSEVRKKLFDEGSMEDFTQALHVNVTGAYFTIVAFLELLDAGNQKALSGGLGGVITGKDGQRSDVPAVQSQVIVTSSISAYSRMKVSTPAYAASKAAVLHLTKQAATNMAKYGIRANALAPGLFPSELAAGLIGSRDPAQETYENPMFIPARRFGGDEEMAGMVLYLASRAGAYCNGMVLVADGGRLAVMPSTY
ncbi:gluconate 5-dehydrogenase [Diplogelasinospora grovesii]|uniref:Gluconate 5-dehydrogenase n=1 Tax=Diplogelasinospora grovesii TaxID=303347 RepID=A0AAN6S3Y0_9PEZI|nr:gluconate 5-dehydrogenase [Diplogelasinospora grovesii]